MTTYCATFGSVSCEIEVQAAASAHGGPVFTAEAFVLEQDGDVLRPIYKAGADHAVELPASDADGAVQRMAGLLSATLGRMTAAPSLCPPRRSPQMVGKPYYLGS
jgi:hypothetical protein